VTAPVEVGRASWLLAAVGTAYGVLQFALGPTRLGFGWDESVYLSQVARHVPAAHFTAPRARGITVIVAPIAAVTTSTAAIRAYLVVLSVVAVVLAFRVWLRVLDTATVVTAAVLFVTLWPALVYGNEVMPNFWVGVFGIASVGWAVQAVTGGGRRTYAGHALLLAAVCLVRPGDALWLGAGTIVGEVLAGHWRSTLPLWSLGGFVLGFLPWVIEAEISYGGLAERLRTSSAIEGSLAPHLGVVYEARALYGPLLCRPCTRPTHSLVLDAWWFAIPIVLAAVLVTGRRRQAHGPLGIAATAAVGVAAPYLALVAYSAPRFLIPAYALVAIPVADGVVRAARRIRAVDRPVLTAIAAVAAGGYLAAQAAAAHGIAAADVAMRRDWQATADALNRIGITSPCVVVGHESPPVGFRAGCASLSTRSDDTAIPGGGRFALDDGRAVAVLVRAGGTPPSYVAGWSSTRVRLTDSVVTVYYAFPSGRPLG